MAKDNKFYTVEKNICGVDYIAQFNGLSLAMRCTDESYIDGTDNISLAKLGAFILDKVIVSPRVSLDSFAKEKIGQEETKEINGVVYTAKFNGIKTALRCTDESYIDGTENLSTEKINKFVLENVITSPENLDIDDFECIEDLREVIDFASDVMWGGADNKKHYHELINFGQRVMQGRFRDKAKKS